MITWAVVHALGIGVLLFPVQLYDSRVQSFLATVGK